MLDVVAKPSVFDNQIFVAFGALFKGMGALFSKEEQPVAVDYIGSKNEGPSFDASHYAFYCVRFLDGAPENQSRYVVAEISPLKDGVEQFSEGHVHFLRSFNPQTLEYDIAGPIVGTEPMPSQEGRARRRWQSKQLNAIAESMRAQEVPVWLFSKLADATVGHKRRGCNASFAKLKFAGNCPQNNI